MPKPDQSILFIKPYYVLNRKWREQLYEMDALKDGIGLRAYAQIDPLVEYLREGVYKDEKGN